MSIFRMAGDFLLVVMMAQLAHGTNLRQPADPPAVDPVKFNMQMDTAAQKISALKIKADFAANSAQASASQAATANMRVEELYTKTMAVLPELDAIKKAAKKQAAMANAASKSTIGTLKAMEKEVKTVQDDAKRLALAGVKSLLKEKYHELDEWRHKVLTNPWERSQVASQKAAKPYFKMMGSFAGSMAAYGLESGAMKSQAQSALANSQALAAGVADKKNAGDVIGAAQDQELANAMKIQSDQFSARATALDGAISQMKNVVPQYATGAHMAAWNAEYATNPDGLPPPPINPNFAFTPPPPQPAKK